MVMIILSRHGQNIHAKVEQRWFPFVIDDNRVVGGRVAAMQISDDHTYSFVNRTLKIIVKHSENRGWLKRRTWKDGDTSELEARFACC